MKCITCLPREVTLEGISNIQQGMSNIQVGALGGAGDAVLPREVTLVAALPMGVTLVVPLPMVVT